MSVEVVNSLVARCASLEDIIRQQEQTFSALLIRLRDVEQRVSTNERTYEATQQQVAAIMNDRGGVMVQFDRVNAALAAQSDRVGALEAVYQGTQTALQGIDQKYDAVVRGIENRVQGDIGSCHQRIQASDQANAEAIRALQVAHQGHITSLQAVDNNARASLDSHQQQVSNDLAGARQRTEALETGMRQALQDVHGALSTDIRSVSTQMDTLLRAAVQNQNEALLALDQRVRGEMLQLNSQEQNDMNAMRSRTEELEGNLRASILSSHNSLAGDVGSVAQQVQALESRQRAAHQDLIQELSKHDGQMETIDVNWRASVLDLNGKLEGEVNGLQGQIHAGAQAVVAQFNAQQSNFAHLAEQFNHTLSDLAHTVQDRCIVPLESVNVNAARQNERINRLNDETEAMREYMRTFSQEVDRTTSQFRQIMEAAVRTSHTDLLERINTVAAASALRADPDEVYAQINTALTKIWGDVSSTYTTQRDLNEIQGQIATLETAVRTEILSLVQKNNEVLGKLDEAQEAAPRAAAASRRASKRASEANASVADGAPSTGARSVTEVSQMDMPIPIVHEPEMDVEELRALSEEAIRSAKTAEEAERRCVASLNENKAVLDAMVSLRAAVERQREEVAQLAERATAAPAQVPRAADEVVAAPPPPPLPPAKETTRAASAGPESGFPSSPQSSDIRRVSGLVNKQEFIVRRASGDGSNRGSPATITRDTPTDVTGNAATPTSEILLPTHQFLRKKEFNTFKEYVGHETEAIWAELLKLRRNSGVPKEEVQLLNAQNKQDIVQTVLLTMSNQERELVHALRTIQLELNAALRDMHATSQVDVIQGNGFTDFAALREALMSGSSAPGAASPKLLAHAQEPAAEMAPSPRDGVREGRPPRRPSKPPLSARPLRADEEEQPVAGVPPERYEDDEVPSSARSDQPLPTELVRPVHRRHSLDRDEAAESPRAFVEDAREGPASLHDGGVNRRPQLRSSEEGISEVAYYVPPSATRPKDKAAKGAPMPAAGSYHARRASSFNTSGTTEAAKAQTGPPPPKAAAEEEMEEPFTAPTPQKGDANKHLENKGAWRAPLYDEESRTEEPSPLYNRPPEPLLPHLRAQHYTSAHEPTPQRLVADEREEPIPLSRRTTLAEDFSFSHSGLPVALPPPVPTPAPQPLRAEDYNAPRESAAPPPLPLRAHAYDEPRRPVELPPPLRASEHNEPQRQTAPPIHVTDYSPAAAVSTPTQRAEEFSFSDSRLAQALPKAPTPLAPLRAQDEREPYSPPSVQQFIPKDTDPFVPASLTSSSSSDPRSATYQETTTSDLLTEIAALEKQIELLHRQPNERSTPLTIPIPRAPSVATVAMYNPQLIRVNPTAHAYHLAPLHSTPAPVLPYRIAPAPAAGPSEEREQQVRRPVETPKPRHYSVMTSAANPPPPSYPVLRIEDRPAAAPRRSSGYQLVPQPQLYQAENPRRFAPGRRPTSTPAHTNYTSTVQPRPTSTPLPPVRPLPQRRRSESMTSDPEVRRPQGTVAFPSQEPCSSVAGPVRVLGDHMYQGVVVPTNVPSDRRRSSITTTGARMEPMQTKEGVIRIHPYDVAKQ